MEKEIRKCAYILCGKEFEVHDQRQKYCCPHCKDKARSQRARATNPKDLLPKSRQCSRKDCKMYKEIMGNHCVGLIEIYEDEYACPFYKEKHDTRQRK